VEYDQIREADLRTMGYQILRFTNEEVINDIAGVIEEIHQTLSSMKSLEKRFIGKK